PMERPQRKPDFIVVGDWHEWDPPWWTPAFIYEWVISLEEPFTSDSESYWEKASAVRELKVLDYLVRLTSFSSDQTRRMLRLVIREIDIYRNLYDTSLSIKLDFRRFERMLQLFRLKLDKFTADTETKKITEAANELSSDIQNMLEQLPIAQSEFWRDAVDLTESELRHPMWRWEARERGEPRPQYMIPDWVGQLDYEAPCWKMPKVLTKRANLDTRLQVRLAVVFHLYLPRLSWRTI